LLLKYGADVNAKDTSGRTPLMLAAITLAYGAINYLLLTPDIDIDSRDKDGKTALMWAVSYNVVGMQQSLSNDLSAAIVNELLVAGADPLITSTQGKTARQYVRLPNALSVRLLSLAEDTWLAKNFEASQQLQQKFMISRRLRINQTLPQKDLGDYIIRRSEYDNLCVGLHNNLNKPGVIALAKSLNIKTSNKTKSQLCTEISKRLTI
jgi:ankyrin repeat protein